MDNFAGHKTIVAARAAAFTAIYRVMKLTAILLAGGLLQATAYTGHGQLLTLDVRDESLVNVFAMIKKQTGYVYFGASELLARAKPVTIRVRNEPLTRVLDLCFEGQGLTYTINGKTIGVSERRTAAVVDPALDAMIDVRGRVSNEANEAVAGVSVVVKGTKMGTYTDGDGAFSLARVSSEAVLVLTAVNIQTIEAPVGGRRVLDLKVKGKTGKLDEVQVIAYGKTSQRFNVGNVVTVKAEDIEKQPVQNPLLALQGRVPGLEVTQLTGMPGGGVTVRIQGRNSIQSGLEPLVVIDGVPFPTQLMRPDLGLEYLLQQGGSPLNFVDPSDIESISVLKDADATAIYGSRAANGAILITTKKGKVGRANLSFNLQQGWGQVNRRLDVLNTRQYLDMRYEAIKNDGLDLTTISGTNRSFSDLKVWDTTRHTDWQKQLLGGTAQYTKITASISGGAPTMQYLIGANFNRQTTVFPGDFADVNGGMHFSLGTSAFNQKLNLQLSGSYMVDENQLPSVDLTTQALVLAPHSPALYDANGNLNWEINSAGSSTWINPLAYTQYSDYTNTSKNLITSANLSYDILSTLELSCSFGYNNLQNESYYPILINAAPPEDRPFSQRTALYADRKMSSWIIEPQLHFKSGFGKAKVEALLGSTIHKSSTSILALQGSGYNSDQVMKSLYAATAVQVTGSAMNVYRYNALFGRLNVNWEEKYIINLTARRDGSSRFGDENKFHNFGSVGVGWIFSEEKWIKSKIAFLSFGKLRASYGTTGNDQVTDYSYLSLYNFATPTVPYQNSTSLSTQNISNPYLQWEATRKWQGGIDLGFFNDRLIINATYARNRSSNQLIDYQLPSTTGFTGMLQNFPALIQNTSWEFTGNATIIKRNNFNWTTGVNFTIPRNKVVNFPNIESTPYASGNIGVIIGHPLGINKAYRFHGVDQATGEYQVLDKDGNPTSTGNFLTDRTQLLTIQPTIYGGWQNSISFKGFQLDFLFQLVQKKGPKNFYYFNDVSAPGRFNRYSGGNQPVTVMDRWQKPGDNATIARFTTGNDVFLWPIESDVYYSYESSFIRLKNVSLSWQFPAALLRKLHLKNFRLYFQGQNLATISQYTGLDPESGSTALPPLQLSTLGIQIEL